MKEFTGERVIPGQVNDDLWAEHSSRYAFASRLAGGRRALDIGCGTGYGTYELSQAAKFTAGCDISTDAIEYARTNYLGPHFLRGSATALPFATASFNLITAFEVIEHLEDWQTLLKESARVLAPDGILLVSTPNKLYYAESRAEHGPNPYHQHEFEYAEFRTALTEVFCYTTVFLQNRLEAFAFYPADHYAGAETSIEAMSALYTDANFFIAICSHQPFTEPSALVHVPRTTNLLRERERHIHLLEGELAQNQQWLADIMRDRAELQREHADLEQHLDKQNRWALGLEQSWKAASERVVELQNELQQVNAGYERQVAELERENRDKTKWALDTEERLTAELKTRAAEHAATVGLLEASEAALVERTQWAHSVDARLQEQLRKMTLVRQSRWVRLGRLVGLGPDLDGGAAKPSE